MQQSFKYLFLGLSLLLCLQAGFVHAQCSTHSDCTSCAGDAASTCYWCPSITGTSGTCQATSLCNNGLFTFTGFRYCCNHRSSCASCLSIAGCSWCNSSASSCAYSTNPAQLCTLDGGTVLTTTCPSCSGHTTCGSCDHADPACLWCVGASTSVCANTTCPSQTSAPPTCDACSDPSDTCESCKAKLNCNWCSPLIGIPNCETNCSGGSTVSVCPTPTSLIASLAPAPSTMANPVPSSPATGPVPTNPVSSNPVPSNLLPSTRVPSNPVNSPSPVQIPSNQVASPSKGPATVTVPTPTVAAAASSRVNTPASGGAAQTPPTGVAVPTLLSSQQAVSSQGPGITPQSPGGVSGLVPFISLSILFALSTAL